LRLRSELLRKSIHLATVGVPAMAWLLPRGSAIAILALGTAMALTVEWARAGSRLARYLFLTRTRRLLRGREARGLSGATFMAIGYLAVLVLYPLPVAVVAMLYLGLGDASAALIGKRIGRHATPWGKSWEGTAAGFSVNLAVGLAMIGIPPGAALAGAIAASAAELLPVPPDDNLTVPVIGGGVLWIVTLLLGGIA